MSDVGLAPGGQRRYSYYFQPIGRFLDQLDARYVTLGEIEGGFVWHCYKRGAPLEAISGVIAFEDVQELIESDTRSRATVGRNREAERRTRGAGWLLRHRGRGGGSRLPHPLFPLGYAETLLSVGAKLEDQRAYCPLLAERDTSLLVVCSLPLPSYIRLDVTKMETFTGMHEVEYSKNDVHQIVMYYRGRRDPLH